MPDATEPVVGDVYLYPMFRHDDEWLPIGCAPMRTGILCSREAMDSLWIEVREMGLRRSEHLRIGLWVELAGSPPPPVRLLDVAELHPRAFYTA